MYSSSNSINPFSPLPPALYPSPSPSFPSLDNDCDINFLHQQHSDLLLSEFLHTNYPLIETTHDSGTGVSNKAKPTNQDTSDHEQVNGNRHCIISPQNLLPRKKDRHSKIYTAQGPRDRRVRLSIDISRKFFDLQDMLGFDKASKTLDWLLTNSKAAIKELMLAKNRSNGGGDKSFSSTNSECEIVSLSETNEGGDSGDLMEIVSKTKEKPLLSLSEEREKKRPHKIAFHGIAKESRAKARARARERTREKMSTQRVIIGSSKVPPYSSPADHVLNQSATLTQIGASDQRMVDSHNHNKSPTSSIMKNLAKDAVGCPSIPQNWDIVDHAPQLILWHDQHEYLWPANLGVVCNNHNRP